MVLAFQLGRSQRNEKSLRRLGWHLCSLCSGFSSAEEQRLVSSRTGLAIPNHLAPLNDQVDVLEVTQVGKWI